MNDLHQLAKAAARRVSFQWPSVIDEDDLAQDICVRILESPSAMERIEVEDEITRKAFMVKVAHQVASDQMVEFDRFSGNYLYDTVEVRSLLEEQAWLLQADKLSSEVMDLKESMDNLAQRNSSYFASIVNRFQYDIVPDDSAGRMRVTRAVASLTEEMNLVGARRRKDHIEGPGTRRAISNEAARRITRRDYSGDSVSYRAGENDAG